MPEFARKDKAANEVGNVSGLALRYWLEEVTQNIRSQVTSEQRAIAKKNIESIADWRVA